MCNKVYKTIVPWPSVIEQARNFFNTNLYSQNMKRIVTNEAASAKMHVAAHIVELAISSFSISSFYGIVVFRSIIIPEDQHYIT